MPSAATPAAVVVIEVMAAVEHYSSLGLGVGFPLARYRWM